MLNGENKKELYLIMGLIVLSILIRFILFLASDYSLDAIGTEYMFMVRKILEGDFLNVNMIQPQHILYPFIIAIFSKIIPDLALSGIWVSIIMSGLLIVPVYLLARDIFSKQVAAISCILLIFYPHINYFAYSALSEPTYYFFIMSSVSLLWLYLRSKNYILLIMSSLFCGLAYLTRPEAIAYLGFSFLLLISLAFIKKDSTYFFSSLIYFTLFSVVILPHIILLYEQTGTFILSGYQNVLAMDLPAIRHRNVHDLDKFAPHLIFPYILSNLNLFIIKVVKNLREYINSVPQIFSIPFIFVTSVGIVRKNNISNNVNGILYLIYFAVPTFLIISFAQFRLRYLYTILPILIIFLANGVFESQYWLREILLKSERSKLVRKILSTPNYLLIFVLIMLLPTGFIRPVFYKQLNLQPVHDIESKEVGLWIKKNMPQDYLLLTNSEVTIFYAEREYYDYGFDLDPIETVNRFLAKGKSVYLAVAQRKLIFEESSDSSKWLFLLDEKKAPSNFKPVLIMNQYPHAKVIVYEIRS